MTPNDQSDFSDRLQRRLQRGPIDLPSVPGSHSAVHRAQQRIRNRRSAAAGLTAFALVAGITTQSLRSGDEAELDTASRAAQIDGDGVAFDVAVADGGLVGLHGDDDSALVGDDIYAISTAPGTVADDYPDYRSAPQALYRLGADGTWEPTVLDGDDPYIDGISARDGVLYALSTGTATDRDGVPRGSVSTDGGDTWATVPLEAATPPSTTFDWDIDYRMEIHSIPGATLAAVSASARIPYTDLFPEVAGDASMVTVDTEDGIELREYDPDSGESGALRRMVTWSDMGITGPSDLRLSRVLYRADEESWTPVSVEEAAGLGDVSLVSLQASESHFLARIATPVEDHQSDGTESETWLLSADGRSWESVVAPTAYVGDLTMVGTTLVALGYGEEGALLYASDDRGATWVPIDLRGLVFGPDGDDDSVLQLELLDAGPLGLAVMASVAEIEPDAAPATTTTRPSPPSTQTPTTQTPTSQAPADVEDRRMLMAFTTDLSSWSIVDLDADGPLPASARFEQVTVGTDKVIVNVATTEGQPATPARTRTVVATPIR